MTKRKSVTIRVADWTTTPGPRERKHGLWSAEQFCDEVLGAPFAEAVEDGAKVIVDLDGVAGYLPSFLEETFGGLARKYTSEVVAKHLEIICDDDRITLEEAWDYVRNPQPPKRPIS